MKMIEKYNTERLLKSIVICLAFMLLPLLLYSQSDKKFIRQGNREYNKEKYQESEVSYRKAIDDNRRSPDAVFNIGDALYKQNKYDEAAKQFAENVNMNEDREKKAAGLYNMGNSFLKSGKLKESIDAYKGSLKLVPDNFEAKYNLAYAQDMLTKQEQQQQQQEQQQNQDKENQENKDQKDNQDKQNDDQQNKDQKENQQQKQQKPQEQTISKEDAQRLLNSLANDEKNVQEKVKLAKAARERKLTVKNW
jgi:tetratricopeptide (TPR) repeat protein